MTVSRLWPLGMLAALAAPPAYGQVRLESTGQVEIAAPAGINISQDVPTRILLSQSSITFVARNSPGLEIGGFIEAGAEDAPDGLILRQDAVYALSGTTLDQQMFSISVAPGPEGGGPADPDEALRTIVAQFN